MSNKGKAPEYIRINGHVYKRALHDPEVTSALSLMESAKGKFSQAKTPEEILQAKAELAQAAKNLLDSVA
jgi:hypothetical protein